MICNNCGLEIRDDAKFCRGCGTRVEFVPRVDLIPEVDIAPVTIDEIEEESIIIAPEYYEDTILETETFEDQEPMIYEEDTSKDFFSDYTAEKEIPYVEEPADIQEDYYTPEDEMTETSPLQNDSAYAVAEELAFVIEKLTQISEKCKELEQAAPVEKEVVVAAPSFENEYQMQLALTEELKKSLAEKEAFAEKTTEEMNFLKRQNKEYRTEIHNLNNLLEKCYNEIQEAKAQAKSAKNEVSQLQNRVSELENENSSLRQIAMGAQQPVSNVCPTCGAPIDENNIFCGDCGTRVR